MQETASDLMRIFPETKKIIKNVQKKNKGFTMSGIMHLMATQFESQSASFTK